MIVYHGTVDKYLPSIEKSGLKVVPKNRYAADVLTPWGSSIPMDMEQGVYVSTKRLAADNFALMRALWLSVPVGEAIDPNIGHAMLKRAGSVVLDAKPIVLKLELDEHLASTLQPDNRSAGHVAFWTSAVIPPTCIKAVLTPDQKPQYWEESDRASN